jgi:hypothetical protein
MSFDFLSRRSLLKRAALAAAAFPLCEYTFAHSGNQIMSGKYMPTWDSLKLC